MENINYPAALSSCGSSLSETLSETGGGGGGTGLNSSDNLERQKNLVKQREIELKEMQDQIESYNQIVKQLTSQRELAVKRLADMDVKIKEMTATLETERHLVDTKDQELKSKRTQLQTLKNEEDELKSEFERSKRDLEVTTENLTTTQLSSSQVKNKLSELRLFLNTTNTTIEEIESAINYRDTLRLSSLCNQPLAAAPLTLNSILTNGRANSNMNDSKEPRSGGEVSSCDPFSEDPFQGDDPFAGDDPFKSEEADLALPEDDPFNPSSTVASNVPFSTSPIDPFASPLRPMDGF